MLRVLLVARRLIIRKCGPKLFSCLWLIIYRQSHKDWNWRFHLRSTHYNYTSVTNSIINHYCKKNTNHTLLSRIQSSRCRRFDINPHTLAAHIPCFCRSHDSSPALLYQRLHFATLSFTTRDERISAAQPQAAPNYLPCHVSRLVMRNNVAASSPPLLDL